MLPCLKNFPCYFLVNKSKNLLVFPHKHFAYSKKTILLIFSIIVLIL